MMWFWSSGYGWSMWVFSAVMMLVLWAGLAWLMVMVITSLRTRNAADDETAMEALRGRLARGEISAEEFERLRRVIGPQARHTSAP